MIYIYQRGGKQQKGSFLQEVRRTQNECLTFMSILPQHLSISNTKQLNQLHISIPFHVLPKHILPDTLASS